MCLGWVLVGGGEGGISGRRGGGVLGPVVTRV